MRFVTCLLASATAAVSCLASPASAGDQSDLRVLFVGPNPVNVRASVTELLFMYDKAEESYAQHTPAFQALLEEHFKHVGVVYGEDFTPDMAADYDVVILDAMPPQTSTVQQSYTDANGMTESYDVPAYLPVDYDTPTILIGYVAPQVSGPIGTKLDWL